MAKYEKFADAVRIQYLHYQEKYKNKLKTNDYLKHVPPSLTPIHEYSDEMGMLFLNNKSNELIYALRGLDFGLIQQNIPSVTLGSSIGSLLGGQMSSTRRQNKYLQNTGKLIGGLAGGYAFGNKEVRSAIDIIIGGINNNDNKEVNSKFINEYQNSLNIELFKLREIQSNFPNTKLILTGHSRGGILASDLSKVLKLEAHLFNPAESSVFSNLLLQMALPLLTSNQDNNKNNKYDYSLLGDSNLSNNKNSVSYKKIVDAAERYSALRDNGLLKKYSLDLDETDNNLDLINPFNLIGKKSFTSSLIKPEDRIVENNKNISIYRTENDLVSMGYSDIYNVDLRAEVEPSFIEKIIGAHNVDHFISNNLFNSITNDIKIEPYEEEQLIQQQVKPYQSYRNDNIFVNLGSPRFVSLNPYALCLESGNELECAKYA